ncbi:MAG: hypothetical protein ACI93P_002529 [bacterium]|jgi:hypothetical protein
MEIQFEIAKYVLNESHESLPNLAYDAMLNGYESESMTILAGMTVQDSMSERIQYFQKGLDELGLKLPQKREAAITLLKHYLTEIIDNPNNSYEYMIRIDNELYKPIFLEESSTKKYVGEEIGLEKMYTWYRELQDFKDESRLLYYNELPKESQKQKFIEHLTEEANNLLKSRSFEK